MRLGDFRKETKDLPDDWVLDEVMFIDPQPSYYDGFPCDYVNHKLVYTCENKIRFRIFDPESRLWDICDPLKSYDENLIEYMKVFTRGRGIPDERWENYLGRKRHDFDENWNNSEWQHYMLGERAKDAGKKEII